MASNGVSICVLCGIEVVRKGNVGRIPDRHPACKQFQAGIDQAMRAIPWIVAMSPEQALHVKRGVFQVLNALPVVTVRGERGKFVTK